MAARELALYALLGAIMFALKMVLAALPNIEPVSLLLIVYTLVFGKRAIWPLYTYVILECLTWGVNLWTINYMYVWLFLFWAVYALRHMHTPLGWAVLAGAYGLLFGVLCAPVYWITGGWGAAVSWWISGIPYDILHCIGNFLMVLVLYRPCYRVLQKLAVQYGFTSSVNGLE